MDIRFAHDADLSTRVVFKWQDGDFITPTNTSAGPVLEEALKATKFEGKAGQSEIFLKPAFASCDRVVVFGLGKKNSSLLDAKDLGGKLYACLSALPIEAALVPGFAVDGQTEADTVAKVALGVLLRSYRFDKYKTKEKDDAKKPTLTSLTFAVADTGTAEAAYKIDEAVAKAVHHTRTLQNEPANIIYPETLAEAARDVLSKSNVKVEILGEKELKKMGFGALVGVGQGSENESKVVIMHYHGAEDKKDAPLAFVGKGVTFDTGGISIKPSGGMEDMKWDMGGAGVVIGLMQALSTRQAKVNAIGIVGLVENMPSGNAQRPGDIVTSYSGQTIEVLNTDAEGRLVLADILWYVQEKYAPKVVIDLATLTGAIIVALGELTAGLFSNDNTLAQQLAAAADKAGEPVWRLPLRDDYDKDIDSDFADMRNIGSGRGAGSITAAQFLQRFIKEGQAWAHIDIAGVTWTKKPTATAPKGATGFGLQLLNQYVADVYES